MIALEVLHGKKKGLIWCKGKKESEICGFILFQEKSQNSLRIHSQLSIHGPPRWGTTWELLPLHGEQKPLFTKQTLPELEDGLWC